MDVGCWHEPESAGSSAIQSLPGDNRTFSNPGSTLNTAAVQHPDNAPNSPVLR